MSNTTMTDPDDRRDQLCTKCGVGVYAETSIHDDWDGVLHCTNKACNHEVTRYKWKDDPKPQPESVESELSPAAQAVVDAAITGRGYLQPAIAAALRAAADQVVPPAVMLEYYERNESPVLGKAIEIRGKLLFIAAELEAQAN